MEPIISPWVIYAIELLNPLNEFLIVAIMLSGIVCIVMLACAYDDDNDEDDQLASRKSLLNQESLGFSHGECQFTNGNIVRFDFNEWGAISRRGDEIEQCLGI